MSEQRNAPGAVVISGHTFASTVDTKSWLYKYANNTLGYLLMVDPHSFLAIASETVVNSTSRELSESENTFLEAGYECWEDGTVKQSFNWKVPEIFGKVPADGGTMLTAIATYEMFDSALIPCTGYMYTIKDAVDDCEKDLVMTLEHGIHRDGQEVAVVCVRDAARFCRELITWMADMYEHLNYKNLQSPKQNWELVSHCVRAIFGYLHDARRCNGKFCGGTNAQTMWATLRGREAANEFLEHWFYFHAVVQNVLIIHKQRNEVLGTRY